MISVTLTGWWLWFAVLLLLAALAIAIAAIILVKKKHNSNKACCPIPATGPTGLEGHEGPDGPEGASGPTGAQGATGVTGSTGAIGTVGATGATGTNLPISYPFAAGPVGVTGVAITAGVTGGLAVGFGASNCQNTNIGLPPIDGIDAMDTMAFAVTRDGVLQNLVVDLDVQNRNVDTSETVVASIWTAPCNSAAFTETVLLVSQLQPAGARQRLCLSAPGISVPVTAGTKVTLFVRTTSFLANVFHCAAGLEFV